MPENDTEKTLVSNMLYKIPKQLSFLNSFNTNSMCNTQTHNTVQFLGNTSVALLDTYVYVVPLFTDSMTIAQKLLKTYLSN
jgi:hypothetical protein